MGEGITINKIEYERSCPVCLRNTLNESFCLGCGATFDEVVKNPMEGIEDVEKLDLGYNWLVNDTLTSVRILKLNRMITAVGPVGSGKSYSGLTFCASIDSSFSVDNVLFAGIEYVRSVSDKTIKQGTALLWDDCGLGAPAREFWSSINKAIGLIAQSSRFRRLVLFMTIPDKTFLDSQPRRLTDIHLSFLRREEGKSVCARIYLVDVNKQSGKIFYKHPVLLDERRGPRKIEMIRFPRLPPKKLIEEYETKKQRYLMEFYENLYNELESGSVAMTNYQAKMLMILTEYNDKMGYTRRHLSERLGIRETSLSRAIKKAKLLGY